jgi:hypothetical protein
MQAGDCFYVAFPDGVEIVEFVTEGTGNHNVKSGHFHDPVVVRMRVPEGGDYVVSRAELYTSPLAAAIRSAELAKEIDTE